MSHAEAKSSMFNSYAYFPADQILEVQFKNGTTYRYFDFPQEAYEAFVSAESMGKYFQYAIRGVYRYARVDPADPEESENTE